MQGIRPEAHEYRLAAYNILSSEGRTLGKRRFLGIKFGAANESVYYTQFAVRSFRIYLCMMVFACINKGTFIYLQSLGKALASTALSMVREVVFGVGFALLLPRFFGLDGVLYSMPVSDILTFIIAAVLIRRTWRELKQEGGKSCAELIARLAAGNP